MKMSRASPLVSGGRGSHLRDAPCRCRQWLRGPFSVVREHETVQPSQAGGDICEDGIYSIVLSR